ncbi:MAG TPA: DUF1328 domain-containing protein [Deltaproteobacteria bacterium]|nr:DUF1328 domain-containing protein [Deltaproteobacteria bacterium]HQJ09533.1 DUF1328 domain-containing protein [Deltaproteobacteria bacterium]
MLRWAILFLIGAGIAAILGFIIFVDILSFIFKLLAIALFILFVVTYLKGRGRVIT